jgi:hypothetical protein
MNVVPLETPRRRILLVATAAPRVGDLRRLPRTADVVVLCPPLSDFVHRWASDVWPARRRAARMLERTLQALDAAGVPGNGRVGADEPPQALADAVRTLAPDEVVLCTSPTPSRAEAGLLRFSERLAVPTSRLRGPPADAPLLRNANAALSRRPGGTGPLARMAQGRLPW